MARENRQLMEILDQEFTRLRQSGGGTFRTLREMAIHLGIDPTMLSRFKSGDRPIPHNWATKFAERLVSDDPIRQQELADRLFAAKPPREDADIAVAKWFEERGRPGYLMLVEFFEPPVLRTRSSLSEDVAAAVARGMCYGILCPFSARESADPEMPLPLRNYLMLIWDAVQSLYLLLLQLTLEQAKEDWSKDGSENLQEKLEEAAGRLRLYRAVDGDGNKAPAIGHRLFYCRDLNTNPLGDPELWQWNTTPVGEQMLKRHMEAFEREAVEALLYPLPQWAESQPGGMGCRLPRNQDMSSYRYENRHKQRPGGQFPAQERWALVEFPEEVKLEIGNVLKGVHADDGSQSK